MTKIETKTDLPKDLKLKNSRNKDQKDQSELSQRIRAAEWIGKAAAVMPHDLSS